MLRGLWLCIFLLSSPLMRGQESVNPRQIAGSEGSIRVEVVEGDGAINSIRLHRAHDAVIKVTDARGEPLPGATVTFMLPVSGPSAAFPDGGQSATVQTDDHGAAAARGLRPNAIAGQFQIRAKASLLGSTAEAIVVQTNAEPVIRTGHTKLIVILVAVGGAAAGGAALALHGKSTPADAPSGGGAITAGAPIFGPPH
jgi:hypothetical protein